MFRLLTTFVLFSNKIKMKREEKRKKGRNICRERENNEKEGNGIDGNYL